MQNKPGFLNYLSMLQISIMLCSSVLMYKPIDFGLGVAPAAILVTPLWFILSDVLAEVYGLSVSRKILLWGFLCQLLFSTICFVVIRSPSPAYWDGNTAANLILGHLLHVTIAVFAGIVIAGYLNIYFLSKWRILLRGRYFWIRSMGAALVGEAIYSVIAVILIQIGNVPLINIPQIIFISILFKIIFLIAYSVPANFLVFYIRHVEKIPEYKELALEKS